MEEDCLPPRLLLKLLLLLLLILILMQLNLQGPPWEAVEEADPTRRCGVAVAVAGPPGRASPPSVVRRLVAKVAVTDESKLTRHCHCHCHQSQSL